MSQPSEKMPMHMTRLYLYGYNKDHIDNIPSSLTHLTFGLECNQKLLNNIPNTLTHLALEMKVGKEIIIVPETVTCFHIGAACEDTMNVVVPKSVRELRIMGNQYIRLHDGIVCLKFGGRMNPNIIIPGTVTDLDIGKCCHRVKNIPENVKRLEINFINEPLPNKIIHLIYTGSGFKKIKKYIK